MLILADLCRYTNNRWTSRSVRRPIERGTGDYDPRQIAGPIDSQSVWLFQRGMRRSAQAPNCVPARTRRYVLLGMAEAAFPLGRFPLPASGPRQMRSPRLFVQSARRDRRSGSAPPYRPRPTKRRWARSRRLLRFGVQLRLRGFHSFVQQLGLPHFVVRRCARLPLSDLCWRHRSRVSAAVPLRESIRWPVQSSPLHFVQ